MANTGFGTRAAFGLGGAPIGVVQNGIAFFLLIYYNQVLGLDAGLAALALSIAIFFDAVSDPLVGFLSDNCKSRLGRRHPFLYAAALPAGLFYYLVWHPEQVTSDANLFAFLLVTAILLRTSVTLFDIPHNALIAELSSDYHERTTLATYKIAFLQFFGYVIVLAMYSVWLVPTEEFAYGILNKDGYQSAGVTSAILITAFMLLAAAGLHSKISALREFAHEASISLQALTDQLSGVFSIQSFRAMIVSGLFSAIGSGLYYALWAYVMNYYWGLDSMQTFYVLCANFLGAILGSLTAPSYLSRGEKKRNAIVLSCVFVLISALPYLFRMGGYFPANGTTELVAILLLHGVAQVLVSIWISAVSWSMMADITEHSMLAGGYQSEGIILAATTFTQKAGIGGGLIVAGSILEFVRFPVQAGFGDLDAGVIFDLGLYFVIATSILYLVSVWALTRYRIDRRSHEEAARAVSPLKSRSGTTDTSGS